MPTYTYRCIEGHTCCEQGLHALSCDVPAKTAHNNMGGIARNMIFFERQFVAKFTPIGVFLAFGPPKLYAKSESPEFCASALTNNLSITHLPHQTRRENPR
jgi:hypothetical protein